MKNNYMAKKYTTEQDKRIKRDRTIKQMEIQHKEDLDIIAVLTQENLKLGKINSDLRNRFIKGGIIYTINNGYLSSVKIMNEISLYTYNQEIDDRIIKYIDTPLYAKTPFGIEDGRKLKVDEDQWKKFIGGIL